MILSVIEVTEGEEGFMQVSFCLYLSEIKSYFLYVFSDSYDLLNSFFSNGQNVWMFAELHIYVLLKCELLLHMYVLSVQR